MFIYISVVHATLESLSWLFGSDGNEIICFLTLSWDRHELLEQSRAVII